MQESATTGLTQFSPGHLRSMGLRPTRQRQLLATLLFGKGDRHISAETIFEEAKALGHRISLATIYNNLKKFKNAGLIREVLVGGGKVFFDTNTSSHYHYLVEDDDTLIDIPEGSIAVSCSHTLPAGFQVIGVDVVIRARAGRCLGCSRLADCLSISSDEATCTAKA